MVIHSSHSDKQRNLDKTIRETACPSKIKAAGSLFIATMEICNRGGKGHGGSQPLLNLTTAMSKGLLKVGILRPVFWSLNNHLQTTTLYTILVGMKARATFLEENRAIIF